MKGFIQTLMAFPATWKRQWRISQANHKYIESATFIERVKETAYWAWNYSKP